MENITAPKSAMLDPVSPANHRPPADLPPSEHTTTIEPLEQLEEPKVRTKLRIYTILVSLCLVLFVAALDQTIVATSISTISAALNSASGYVWIGGAYVLTNAAAGPIWAKCSDIWGRKPALLAAVAIFAVASMIAALSTSMPMFIAARALQGTAGGGLFPLVTITISDLFNMRSRALYIGFLGVIWALAGTAGPLIGGAFTQLLNVHNPRTKLAEGLMAIDWLGTLSILAVTILLLLGLDFGGAIFPWDSPKVICLIVFGTLMIGFFLFSEKRLAKYPLMPLTIFDNWSNNATFLVAIAHSMVAIGAEYYLPLYFQSVKQASPVRSGILILPMMITESVVDVVVGILIHQTGRYTEIIWAGAAIMTLGTGLYIYLGTDTSVSTIVGFEIIAGIGTALLFSSPTIAIQNSVSQADTATATATLGFFRNLATALSIVLGGVVFQNSMDARQATLAAARLSESALEALAGDQAVANVEIVKSIQDAVQRRVVQDAFAWSLRNMFIMYTNISAIAMVASAFIKHQNLRTEHTETRTGIEQLTKRAA